MTAKNFSQMTNRKLKALLKTASDEDKKEIEEILALREHEAASAVQTAPANQEPYCGGEQEELSKEEQEKIEEKIKEAENNGGVNPDYTGHIQSKKQKMTDEERHALALELEKNVNHRCQAVPFNTAEWVDGYIAGIIEEKRTNKVLYAIKTDDGRRIVKVSDSNLIRILEEVVEPVRKTRAPRTKSSVERPEWTQEEIAEEVNSVIGNVGKMVEFERYHTVDEAGNEHTEMVKGRIVAIIPDKRAQRLIYRISVSAPIEGNPMNVKLMHKVAKAEGLVIAEEFDEEGAELNAKYIKHREAIANRIPLTPHDRVVKCEENVAKAKEKLQKAQKDLEEKEKQLEDAKKELDEFLANQNNTSGQTETNSADNDPLS